MPLQHHAENTTLQPVYQSETTQTAPPHDASAIVINTIAERRYDASTVQQIIALAEQMQTRHRETLSSADIVKLGREVGVEPEFARRALSEWKMQPAGTLQTLRRSRPKRQKPTSLWRARAWVLSPLLAYVVAVPVLMTYLSKATETATQTQGHHRQNQPMPLYWIICYCVELAFPTLLAFAVGCWQKSRREAAGLGAMYGLAPLLAIGAAILTSVMLPTRTQGYSGMSAWTFLAYGAVVIFLLAGTWMGVGALFALGGATVRRKPSARRSAIRRTRTAKSEWV